MSQSIDWAYWRKLPELRVFEAVSLLHGTEPESEPPDDASPEYRKTLRLLLACLADRSFFTPVTLNMGDPALHGVKLAEVGRWALTNGYKLQDGFPQLVAATSKPTIDWPFWKAMRTVKLWQACALIAGLDPDKLKQSPQAWMAGPGSGPVFDNKSFSSPDNKARFEKALRLAESAVSYMDGPIYPKGQPHPGNNKVKDVLLSEVVAFFVSCEWSDIPPPLSGVFQSKENPEQPAIKKEGFVLKKAALIKKYVDEWPTIDADFNHASENGLASAAKATGHGDWYESAVLAWADQRGKRTKQEAKKVKNSVFNLPGTKHTLKG